MKTLPLLLLTISFSCLLTSCQNRSEKTLEETTLDDSKDQNMGGDGMIRISKAQFEASNMQLGPLVRAAFPKTIRANGSIDVPPKSRVAVSVYYGGYVQGLDLIPGQAVRKGQVLFALENPDFVQMQQDYLEAKEQLTHLQADFERQQTLAAENISSQKSYLKAESDYKVQQARSEGLRKQLEMLGFSIEKVDARDFSTRVNIFAPISGFVTQIGTSPGSFLNAADVAVQITNLDHLHVELDIFEKDIDKVRKGQKIHFRVAGTPETTYEADVYLIGSIVEGENRVVRVHGHLEDEHAAHQLLPGMYIEAEVTIESDEAHALPEEAVVREEEAFFILVQKEQSGDSYAFEKVEVHPGETAKGMIAISDPIDQDAVILIKGAFNLIQGEEGG